MSPNEKTAKYNITEVIMFELFGFFAFMLLGLWLDYRATTFKQAFIAIFVLFAGTIGFLELLFIKLLKLLWYIVA